MDIKREIALHIKKLCLNSIKKHCPTVCSVVAITPLKEKLGIKTDTDICKNCPVNRDVCHATFGKPKERLEKINEWLDENAQLEFEF